MLSAQEGMDVWKMDGRGRSVDVRMSRERYLALGELFSHCHLLEESVEDLVQESEQAMFSPRASIWEERFTEEVDDGTAS